MQADDTIMTSTSRSTRNRSNQPRKPRIAAPACECILCGNRCTNARARRLDSPIGASDEPIRSYFEYFSVIPESLIVDANTICPACYKLVVNSSNLYKTFAESVEVLKEVFKAAQRMKGLASDGEDSDVQEIEVIDPVPVKTELEGDDDIVELEVKIEPSDVKEEDEPVDPIDALPSVTKCTACQKHASSNNELCLQCRDRYSPVVMVERVELGANEAERDQSSFTCLGDIDSLWQSMCNNGQATSGLAGDSIEVLDCTDDDIPVVEVSPSGEIVDSVSVRLFLTVLKEFPLIKKYLNASFY